MLSEEEKQAIEYLNDFKSIKIMYGNTFVMFFRTVKKVSTSYRCSIKSYN
jgi:hypothetical protein